MVLHALMLFLHIAGVVVWVGGMFFAYLCLRPTVVELFDPPQRLRLWRGVFARFFVWAGWAATLIAASGLSMFMQHGSGRAPLGWHLMTASGVLMISIYVYVVTVPFNALKRAVEADDWKAGATALNRIRQMVGINLLLGLLTICFATLAQGLA